MKWILIWAILVPRADNSVSGQTGFPTQETCEAARWALMADMEREKKRENTWHGSVIAVCVKNYG